MAQHVRQAEARGTPWDPDRLPTRHLPFFVHKLDLKVQKSNRTSEKRHLPKVTELFGWRVGGLARRSSWNKARQISGPVRHFAVAAGCGLAFRTGAAQVGRYAAVYAETEVHETRGWGQGLGRVGAEGVAGPLAGVDIEHSLQGMLGCRGGVEAKNCDVKHAEEGARENRRIICICKHDLLAVCRRLLAIHRRIGAPGYAVATYSSKLVL